MTAKALKERNARIDRSMQRWAWSILVLMLIVSIGANALSALNDRNSPNIYVSLGIAAFAPFSLFLCTMLLERMRTDLLVKSFLVIVALVALLFSWVHIAHVVQIYGQSAWIAWLFPLIIDVPMLLSGRALMQVRENRTIAAKPATPVRKAAPRKTTPARLKAVG